MYPENHRNYPLQNRFTTGPAILEDFRRNDLLLTCEMCRKKTRKSAFGPNVGLSL